MRNLLSLVFVSVLATAVWSAEPSDTPKARPNVVFILTDDLGYGDLGCYGQKKIRTPNIDRLAAEGMRFTQHYAGNAVCAPTRCVLMTGKHPGHAFIRDNWEMTGNEEFAGQLPIPSSERTVARALQEAGYATGAYGKWGLGGVGSSGDPLRQGFDHFFGYNCQRQAHNYYPAYLIRDDKNVTLDNPAIKLHTCLPKGADTNNPASYAAFVGRQYAPDLIAEEARRFIRENKDRPFFLYFPTTAPHLSLQVPEDSVAEYRGQWPDPPYLGGRSYVPNFTPRATYAAMITRMDREVGRLMALVKELGLDEKTIFVFESDNGPLYDKLGGTDTEFFDSAGPFKGRKGALYEGGVREPLIVRWKGQIAPGSVSDRVVGDEDWFATLLELTGQKNVAPPSTDGISFAPTLLGQAQTPRPFLYREFPGYGGQQSVRMGDWKGIRTKLTAKGTNANTPLRLELYDLSRDIAETHNVADQHPEILARMETLLRAQHAASKEFPFPPLDAPAKP